MENRCVVYRNLRLASCAAGAAHLGRVDDAVIATSGDRILFAGPAAEFEAGSLQIDETIDLGGRWVTPGFIDCHSHVVYGGNRAREFEMRLAGASYEDIARAGGGILSTVKATRALSVSELVAQALPRVDALLADGVTTLEVKSGYGLDIESECTMLRAARALAEHRPVQIVTTYLAAHATPPDYKGRNGDYITEVVLPGLDRAHAEGLVDAVDGFCEGIAFSVAEMARVFDHAAALGLPVKLHAEQLSNLHGSAFAASRGALSADHLEYLDADGAAAMAKAGTVAVILPGAFYTLRETRKPPVDLLRQAGVRMAVATDANPGTSPLTSLTLAMNMAATLFGLTVDECLAGVTREAAAALGLADEIGTLEPGKRADFAVWNVGTLAELVYRMGQPSLDHRIFKGKRI